MSGARTDTPVIDFRARANTKETAQYIGPRLADIRSLGISPIGGGDWYEAPLESIDEFVGRLDRSGIEASVFVGRNRAAKPGWALTNGWVAEMVAAHPGRILGIAGIDATRLDAAETEIREAVTDLGLRGANLDPYQINASADDERFDIVYGTCADLDVPLILTFGAMPGISADLRCWPLALDRVARRYPQLRLIACHGGWPFMKEMIAVAWRHPNVYFDNSFYHFAPGAELIVEAANRMIGDKVLYASAYPFCPLEDTLERYKKLGFEESVQRKVLYENAARLFGLNAKQRDEAAVTVGRSIGNVHRPVGAAV